MQYGKTLITAGLLLSLTSVNAEAALTAYNAAGNTPVVYSSVSNITWTGDANLFLTQANSYAGGAAAYVNAVIASVPGGKINDTPNVYDSPSNSGFHNLSASDFNTSKGRVSWFGAQAFTTYLNSINYAGSNQWALPTAGANPQAGYSQTGGQFGQLFYTELGGTALNPIPNTANFTNEQALAYWLAREYAPNPDIAWGFFTGVGYKDGSYKSDHIYAWAVSPGQVAAVPLPGAAWLFGSSLLGLLGLKRRVNLLEPSSSIVVKE